MALRCSATSLCGLIGHLTAEPASPRRYRAGIASFRRALVGPAKIVLDAPLAVRAVADALFSARVVTDAPLATGVVAANLDD